jgi:hypothetical protein
MSRHEALETTKAPSTEAAPLGVRILMYIFALLAATLYTIWLLNPFPNEYREGASLFIVRLFADGQNPFSNNSPPSLFYMYGFLAPWIISLFDRVFGDHGFFIHRLLALIWLLAAALIVEFEARRLDGGGFPRWLAFLLMFPAGWISHELISRPDNLALVLFVASSVLLARLSHWLAPVAAAVCILLSFYTKQYFVLMTIPLFIASLLVCWRNAFIFGFSFALFFFPSLYVVNDVLPYYFPMALLAFGGTTTDFLHLLKQTAAFGFFYWPLLLLVGLAGVRWLRQHPSSWFNALTITNTLPVIFGGGGKAVSPRLRSIRFYAAVFLINTSFLVWLGLNDGAVMTYFYQLLLPPLIILSASVTFRRERCRKASLYLICIISMLHLSGLYLFTLPLNEMERAEWSEAEALVDKHLNSVALHSPLFVRQALANKVECFDCGLFAVEWLRKAYDRLQVNRSFLACLFPSAPDLIERCDTYTKGCDLKMRKGEFTLIVTGIVSDGEMEQLTQHGYRKAKEMRLRSGAQIWPVKFWLPQYASGATH